MEDYLEIGEYRCRVFMEQEGPGPYLVLLHGYSFTSKIWDDIGLLKKLIENHIPFYAIDMPYGKNSDCNPKRRDIESNLVFLEEIIAKLIDNPDDMVFLGASLGGYVAVRYVIERGGRGLILIGPVGLDEPRILGKADKLDIPVLLIVGERDYIVPISTIKAFAERTRKSTLKIYKDAGHPAYLYNSTEFNNDVLDFMKNIHSS